MARRPLPDRHPAHDRDALFAPPPAETLDIDPEHPVARRLRALSEPDLLLLRRAWDHDRKRLKAQLTVDEVRSSRGFSACLPMARVASSSSIAPTR
jgi:DNA polymerase-3 subunit delta'